MSTGGYFIINYDSTKGNTGITGREANIQYYEVRRNYVLNKKVCLIHDISNILPDKFGDVYTNDNKTSFHVANIGLKYNGTGITSTTIDITPSKTSISTNSVAYPLPIYEEGSTWSVDDTPANAEVRLNGNVAFVVVNSPTTEKKTIVNAKMTKSSGAIDWSRYPNQSGDNTLTGTIGGVSVDGNTPLSATVILRVNPKTKLITLTWTDTTSAAVYGNWFGTIVLS